MSEVTNMKVGDRVLIETLFSHRVGTIKQVMIDPSAPDLPRWTSYLIEYSSDFKTRREVWVRGMNIIGWEKSDPTPLIQNK